MRISDWSSDVCSSDLTFSGKLTVASPTPRNATNCNDVPSSDFCFYDPFEPVGSIGYKKFDVALEKRWNTGSDLSLRVRADVLNVFNWRNWTQFEGWLGGPGQPRNPNFAQHRGHEALLPPRTLKHL